MSQGETATPPAPTVAQPRRPRFGGWLIALAIGLLLAMQIRNWWNPTPDAAAYLSIARSVWSGHGLTSLGSPHLHYAPGYPVLISPVFLTPHPFLWLSVMRFVLAALTLWAVYRWAQPLVPAPGPWFITAGTACNISFWLYYRTPLSDLPMMMWMFGSALAMQRMLAAQRRGAFWGWCALASLLLVMASLTRQAAIVLAGGIAAVTVYQAWRRQISWARAIGAASACLIPPALAVAALVAYEHATAAWGPAQTYVSQLQPTVQAPLLQVAMGLHMRIDQIGRLLVPGMWSSYGKPAQWLDANLLIYLPLTILVIIGWWKIARTRADALLWATPLYVGLYVLWPFDQDTRFFTPLLPVLLVGCWPWLVRLPRGRNAVLVLLCVAHLAVAVVRWVIEIRHDGPEYQMAVPALAALARKLPPQPGPLAASGVSPNTFPWFEYLADRPVLPLTPADAQDGKTGAAEFLLQPATAPLPPHFAAYAQVDNYRLSRRPP